MKNQQICLTGIHKAELVEAEIRNPEPGEALVRMHQSVGRYRRFL